MLVNGLGATPKEELYILYRRVARGLPTRGIDGPPRRGSASTRRRSRWPAPRCRCCGWTTSCRQLIDAPAESPFFVQR